ncbi:hypothetical protein EBB07_33885 [Paenibacillaceae bacterium]|nr:hypothetical protein EBB07_33885 [Paenibacillaceae bacterium]
MSRPKSTNRTAALKLWLKSSRQKKLTEIADELGISPALIRKWKHLDKWDEIPTRRPKGGQPGNKNAVGNSGGPGGPEGNDYAVKHGAYRKFLPQDERFQEILEMARNLDPLDMIWDSVEIAYAKLIDMQTKMYVTDKDEMIKELKKQKFEVVDKGSKEEPNYEQMVTEEEYEFQFSWDRQATDIKAYTVIMRELRSAIKQYLAAAPENDERRLKLELMQAQVNKINADVKILDKQALDEGDKPIEILITRKGERV